MLCSTCVRPFATLWTTTHQLLCPWDFPGKNTGVDWKFFLQWIFQTQGSNLHLLRCKWVLYHWATWEASLNWDYYICAELLQSCPTLEIPWTVACQAPLTMGFPRQECWSGLPFPSLSRGSSRTRDRTCFSYFSCMFFTTSGTWVLVTDGKIFD